MSLKAIFQFRNRKLILWIFLTLVWAAVIYFFSAQNAQSSSQTSGFFVNALLRLFFPFYQNASAAERSLLRNRLSFLIRKGAHFTEYLIMGFLLSGVFRTIQFLRFRSIRIRRFFLTVWITGSLYALTDEMHQMFSDGRSPQLRDVLIDSSGVFAGCCLFCMMLLILRKKRKSRTERDLRSIRQA